jgi:hypothetical protein
MLTVGAAETSSRKGSPGWREVRYASGTTRDADRDRHVDDGPCSPRGGAQPKNAAAAPESCATTKAPADPFVPPSPYPTKTHADYFWFGANKLWTQLRKDGTWQGLPKWADGPSDRRYSGSARAIAGVAIRSQDGRSPGNEWIPRQAPRSNCDVASNGWTNDAEHPFIVRAINLPTLCCWKIAGHYEDGELSFMRG